MLNKILISLVFICLVVALLYGPKFLRVYKMIHLYDQDKIAFNFVNMDKIFQSGSIIPASDNPFKFKSKAFDLPETYVFEDSNQNLMDALDYYETDGLLILKNETILYENYWHDNDQSSKHISWSVAKSFLSASSCKASGCLKLPKFSFLLNKPPPILVYRCTTVKFYLPFSMTIYYKFKLLLSSVNS